LLLDAFPPLVLVVGLASIIALAVLVHEIRILIGAYREASSQNRALSSGKSLAVKTWSRQKPYDQNMREKEQLTNVDEANRVEILDREGDNEWLAEIATKLDPASPEDIELLNTAKTMLRHANYTMGHLSGQSDRLKYFKGQ
jgi:biopolymer transport protein ExbB/TolQ